MNRSRQCKSKKYPDYACGLVKPNNQFYQARGGMCKDCTLVLKKMQRDETKDTTKSKFFRHCPQCNTTLFHTNKIDCDRADREGKTCEACAFANKTASYGLCQIEDCQDQAGKTGLCKYHWDIDWRARNKDYLLADAQKRRAANKEENREYHRKYSNDKMKNDPVYRLRKLVSHDIWLALKRNGSSKGGKSSWKCLSYTPNELRSHLENQFEPWMNWGNHGSYNPITWNDNDQTTWKWNMDHIIPHSTFHYETMDCEEFYECWSLKNLRPLSAKQNVYDSDRGLRKVG